jgi:hypothetical protein
MELSNLDDVMKLQKWDRNILSFVGYQRYIYKPVFGMLLF